MPSPGDLQILLEARLHKRATKKVRPSTFGPSEKHIQAQIADHLTKIEGWRRVITDPVWMRGMGVAETGMADDLYIRYGRPGMGEFTVPGAAQVFWLEAKKKSGSTTDKQLEWHIAERARGAVTCIMGIDCEATYEGFLVFYRGRSLQRGA